MLDHTDQWAEGEDEGQRKVVEANGSKLVYINNFVVTEYNIGMDEFPTSGKGEDWPEGIKEAIMNAAKDHYSDLMAEVQGVMLGSKTSPSSQGWTNLSRMNSIL